MHVVYGYFLTLSKEFVNFHLYVTTFQQHPYMENITLKTKDDRVMRTPLKTGDEPGATLA
jgi:hypothetical protein